MTKKEILILLAVFGAVVTLIVSLLGLAGYLLYVGLEKGGKLADGASAKPAITSKPAGTTTNRPAKAMPPKAGPTAPPKKPTAKLVVEKSRAEKASEAALVEIEGAMELFDEGDYQSSYNQYKRAVSKVRRYRTEFIGEMTADDWGQAQDKTYVDRVAAKAAEMQKEIETGNVDVAKTSSFLNEFRSNQFRKAVEPLSKALQQHMRDFLRNKVLVTVSTRDELYRKAVGRVLEAKFPKAGKYSLAFANDLPQHYGAEPFLRFTVYLKESQATYKPATGSSFRVPHAVTVRFDMRRSYNIQTSWDKLKPGMIKANLPAEVPADVKANVMVATVREGLLPMIDEKLSELIPQFSLFPDIDVNTAKLVTSSNRIDGKVLAAMAAKNPKLLKKRVAELIATPPSTSTTRYLLRELIQQDVEECKDTVLAAFDRMASKDVIYLISTLRRNVRYGNYDVALKVVARPRGEDLIRYLAPYFNQKKVFDTLAGYCRDTKLENRAKIIYSFVSSMEHEKQQPYWDLMIDQDAAVAEMAVRALRQNKQFSDRFVGYYDRMPEKAKVSGLGYLGNQAFTDKTNQRVIQLMTKVVKEEKGALQQAAIRAISSHIRQPYAWSLCAELLPDIANATQASRLRSSLIRYAPANEVGEAFMQKELLAQQKESVKDIADPGKLRRRFYSEPRTATIAGLLRVSSKPQSILKQVTVWYGNNPNDEPLVYAALTAMCAYAKKIDFGWPEAELLIKAGFKGNDVRTRRQSYSAIRLAAKAGKTNYVEMLKKAVNTEKDRRAKYEMEKILRSISQQRP